MHQSTTHQFPTKKGFTLLEALMAGIIFSLVLVASFSLYRYLIELGVDSRNVSNVKNYQQTAFDLLDQMIQVDGWENFMDDHLNKEPFTLVGLNVNTNAMYVIQNSNGNNTTILPAPTTIPTEIYSWTFQIQDDTTLGPYIESITAGSNTYAIKFPTELADNTCTESLDNLLDFINDENLSWEQSTCAVSGDKLTLTITYPSGDNPVRTTGLLLKPSPLLQDSGFNSDMTYTRGVVVPFSESGTPAPTKGYPNVIRATATVTVGEISYRASRYIRYQE